MPSTSTAPSPSASVATLALADGTVFIGRGFGAETESVGEVVFNTSMTGTVELMTDPSYRRQLLCQTVTEVGNVGVAKMDMESDRIHPSALIVRSLSPVVSNWRSDVPLSEWLSEFGVPGLSNIDTRALVRHIRDQGAMMGVVSTVPGHDPVELVQRARDAEPMAGCSLVGEVTASKIHPWTEGLLDEHGTAVAPLRAPTKHVVAVDLGMKHSIARLLVHHGCRVTVVPSTTTADEILALNPDGVFLSNGPGDPSTESGVVETVESLLGTRPIFGICMGHQVLSQALGAKTFKTRFGHRGGNQPVLAPSGRVLITSQNHGFAVDPAGLESQTSPTERETSVAQSHVNLSDGTNEGVSALKQWAFSVQYHPEAAPGPHDARPHFEEFIALMESFSLATSTSTDESAGQESK